MRDGIQLSRRVRLFSLPPPRRGSTKVRIPTFVTNPGPRGNITEEMRDDPERQVIGFNFLVECEVIKIWSPSLLCSIFQWLLILGIGSQSPCDRVNMLVERPRNL